MTCFICNKSISDKKIGEKITEYCDSCDYHKTKNTQKFSESYEEEFWINSDYSEFTGTDFTDKRVKDLIQLIFDMDCMEKQMVEIGYDA